MITRETLLELVARWNKYEEETPDDHEGGAYLQCANELEDLIMLEEVQDEMPPVR